MVDAEKIKVRLRINHCEFDDEITSDIDVAKAKMVRSGISKKMVESLNDPLIDECIEAYVLYIHHDEEDKKDKYRARFDLCMDELRKTSKYKGE